MIEEVEDKPLSLRARKILQVVNNCTTCSKVQVVRWTHDDTYHCTHWEKPPIRRSELTPTGDFTKYLEERVTEDKADDVWRNRNSVSANCVCPEWKPILK